MANAAIVPWRASSEGARALSAALPAPLLDKQSVYLWGGAGSYLINWGLGELEPPMPKTYVLNEPAAVCTCVDKRFFFRLPPTFPRPPHTEDRDMAKSWVYMGKTVLARTIVQGYDGQGLVLVSPQNYESVGGMPQAKLYTELMPSDSEWRVHIFQGDIIIQQQRVRKSNYTGPDSPIRISSNGYGFNIENVPPAVAEAGLLCFDEFELDFAALDIIYNSRENKAYVLEVNSAPELTPYCVEKYAKAINQCIKEVERCYGR